MTSRAQVKITIAKLLELAYSEDGGITTKIVRSKGSFKVTVDQHGNAVLSGNAGTLAFRGSPALAAIGAKVRNVTIYFEPGQGSSINYTATYTFSGAASISISGSFDIEALILSCSGLLCQAARALKGRNAAYERELENIMAR